MQKQSNLKQFIFFRENYFAKEMACFYCKHATQDFKNNKNTVFHKA